MDIKDIIVRGAKANSAQVRKGTGREGKHAPDRRTGRSKYFAELQEYLKKQQTGELSDDELDDVNGGKCKIFLSER